MIVTLGFDATDAPTRLTQAKAGTAMRTALKLQADPAGYGKRMHRVAQGADPNVQSVRAGRDLRLITQRTRDALVPGHAGHHDGACRRAECREPQVHERTGAMQLVEVREAAEPEVLATAPVEVPTDVRPLPINRPFADSSDDRLLDVGVSRDWLEAVRATALAAVDALYDTLPSARAVGAGRVSARRGVRDACDGEAASQTRPATGRSRIVAPPPAPSRKPEPMTEARRWTKEAVASLRTKLIDLGKMNPLISFKHGGRSASLLRIVDERPDLLCAAIGKGAVGSDPLSAEDETPKDELTPAFRIAYERAPHRRGIPRRDRHARR